MDYDIGSYCSCSLLYHWIHSDEIQIAKDWIGTIPHVSFWKDLPFLFKYGVMLPVDLIKGLTGKKKYQEVA